MKWNGTCARLLFMLLLLAPASAHGQATKFSFVSDSNVSAGELAQLTVQAQDASGEGNAVGATTCLHISSDSNTGKVAANETADFLDTLVLTMNSNWQNRNFYYKNNTEETHTLTVSVALKPDDFSCTNWPFTDWDVQWTASQIISVGDGGDQSETSNETQSNNSGSSTATLRDPVVPSIAVKAQADRNLIVGADADFRAQSAGTRGEPLKGARFVWNFGDGTQKEGERVLHHFRYPGRYVVSVTAIVGKFSALDRFVATARPADVFLTSATGDYIELENRAGLDLDLSGWFLRAGSSDFRLPDETSLLANASVRFPSDITKLTSASAANTTLLYPNGAEAARYGKPEQPGKNMNVESTPARVQTSAVAPKASLTPTTEEESKDPAPVNAPDEKFSQQPEEDKQNRQVAAAGNAAPSDTGGILSWMLGLLGIIGAGIVAVALRRMPQSEADEYTIIER